MRKNSRAIAATALLGMLLPIAAQALNSLAAIGTFTWGVILLVVVAGLLVWRWLAARGERDRV